MQTDNPMDVFKREAPEVAQAFDGLIQSLIQTRGLDPKTKQLIYIAMQAAAGNVTAVGFHVPMAKRLGATREEIVDTICLTLATAGLRGVTSCLPAALQAHDAAS